MKKLWGGAFAETTDKLVERFGQSVKTDLNLWQEDVRGAAKVSSAPFPEFVADALPLRGSV